MPIVKDEKLKALLAEGRIAAISIDTNIFDKLAETEALLAINSI